MDIGPICPSNFALSIDGSPPLHQRLILTDDGDVLSPEGYDLDLTREILSVLKKKRAKPKYIRFLRLFFAFELHPNEPTYVFLTEDLQTAVTRCKEFFTSLKLIVEIDDNHLDGGYKVSHDTKISYLRTAVTVVRQLYTRLTGGLRRDPANPMNVNGWHLMNAAERLTWALARQGDKKHSLKHAGGRFQVEGIRRSPPALEDPSRCSFEMTEALIDARVPESVLDIAMVMEANGCRVGGPRKGNGLGWSMASFTDEFWATKKYGEDELNLLLFMPPEVYAHVLARTEAAPHPKRKGSNLLTHLKELAALGTDKAKAELASYALFPSSLGRAYSYSGFYYWFDDAVAGNVFIRTQNSLRKPTSQWYRHASISEDIRSLFAQTQNQDKRREGLQIILQDYGLSTDQTRQYAAFEYLRDGRRRQREKNLRRKEAAASRRQGVPLPAQTRRLTAPGAQEAYESLPIRRRA